MQYLINASHYDGECANGPRDYTLSKLDFSSPSANATPPGILTFVDGTTIFSRLPAPKSMDSSLISLLMPH